MTKFKSKKLITLKITVPSVQAYGSGEEVRITNLETDMRSGETLYVYCKNCDD